MNKGKLIGYSAMLLGALLLVLGVAHASHTAQALVGVGALVGGAGWYAAHKNIAL